MKTAFAPAERCSQEQVKRQHLTLAGLPLVRDLIESMPMTLILNKERQIVFGNQAFTTFLGLDSMDQADGSERILGLRFGEAVGCIRAYLTAGGCGTTPFCQTCCVINSILDSQMMGKPDARNGQLNYTLEDGQTLSLDIRVWSRPTEVDGVDFTLLTVVEISSDKRRAALERIFCHDVLNTAGNIKGLVDLMVQTDMPEEESREMTALVSESADQLLDELSAQRILCSAEGGDLKVESQQLQSLEVLSQIVHQFHSSSVTKDKPVVVDELAESFTFVSDPVLLRRVLINLSKNALSAAPDRKSTRLNSSH